MKFLIKAIKWILISIVFIVLSPLVVISMIGLLFFYEGDWREMMDMEYCTNFRSRRENSLKKLKIKKDQAALKKAMIELNKTIQSLNLSNKE